MPIDPENLKNWKALAAAATAGPWRSRELDSSAAELTTPARSPLVMHGGILKAEDANFIAAARVAVPALIAEIERLRALANVVAAEHGQRSRIAREDHSVCDVCWALADWEKDQAVGTRSRQA